jgi:hypothetical protein
MRPNSNNCPGEWKVRDFDLVFRIWLVGVEPRGLIHFQSFYAVRDAIEESHELPGLTDTRKPLFSRSTLKIY